RPTSCFFFVEKRAPQAVHCYLNGLVKWGRRKKRGSNPSFVLIASAGKEGTPNPGLLFSGVIGLEKMSSDPRNPNPPPPPPPGSSSSALPAGGSYFPLPF
uniref:Uncharacterized protein n=1 Tax=Aegilops tauschii subsp. strangulata TaxID=200361 RepID=A0A453RSR3_AEGTS